MNTDRVKNRTVTLYITFGVILIVLMGRLFYLQIISYDKFLLRAEDNGTRTIDQIPARGLIYDRYGKLIVQNKPIFSATITPSDFDSNNIEEWNYLVARLGLTRDEVREKLIGAWPYTPTIVKENVDFTIIAKMDEERAHHPGLNYRVDILREYAPDFTMPHVMGYMSQITENTIGYYQTADYHGTDYKIGERAGVSGIEKFYEIELRGDKGYHLLQTDAKGRVTKDLGVTKHPRDGFNLYLSVDLEYQKFIENAMGLHKGSIVVIDTRSGEILAAVSKPDYDFRLFVNRISMEDWKNLNENPDKPLFNRIVQSGYPPGSTFKMITAIAGLEEGLVTPEDFVECKGVYQLGGNRFRCWHKGHGNVNVTSAMVRSCDVYFYELAWKLGINRLAKYSRMFGFGEPTGVDIPGERRGIVPTTDYFNSRYGFNNWKGGAVVNLGIGQGEMLVTPIQLVQYAVILANKGVWQTPHLVRYAEEEDGIKRVNFPVKGVAVKAETMEIMRTAMFGVVNFFEGTGKKAAIRAAQVAGKTGTAENILGKVGAGTQAYHGWFVGFAPYEKPEIAVVVLLENGGEGSEIAAPMSATVMNYYFNNVRNKKPYDPLEFKEAEKTKSKLNPETKSIKATASHP